VTLDHGVTRRARLMEAVPLIFAPQRSLSFTQPSLWVQPALYTKRCLDTHSQIVRRRKSTEIGSRNASGKRSRHTAKNCSKNQGRVVVFVPLQNIMASIKTHSHELFTTSRGLILLIKKSRNFLNRRRHSRGFHSEVC